MRLLVDLTRFHRGMFTVAVSGAAVYAICTVASSFAVSYLVDGVIIPGFTGTPDGGSYLLGAGFIIGIGILRAFGVVVRRSFAGVTQWRTVRTLALDVTRKVARQPAQWHRTHMTGDVVARAGVDSEAATAVLAPLPYGTSVLVLLIVSGVWLVSTDAVLGFLALVVIPLLIGMNLAYHRLVEHHYADAQRHLGSFSEAVYESLEGVSVVKAFGAESRETARLSDISTQLLDARSRAVRIRSNFEGFLDAMPSLVNILLLVVGAYRVRAGVLSVGELSGFIYLFTLLVFPLRIIGYVLSEVPHSFSGWRRIREVLDEVVEPDPKQFLQIPKDSQAISLEKVSYTYPTASSSALNLVNIEVPQTAIAAIVGPTGSGKSTLLRVMSGGVRPESGVVRVNNQRIGVVYQESFLFSGTVRDNVTMGNLDIDDGAVWESLRVAALDDFVRTLTKSLDTEVGERGVSLSGGQRQRLALARAVARNASILLIDDTTSALDPETESLVLQRLTTMDPRRTIVLVATRPSAIALADLVFFIEGGQVMDAGAPDDLIKRNDRYRDLISSYSTDRAQSETPGGRQ